MAKKFQISDIILGVITCIAVIAVILMYFNNDEYDNSAKQVSVQQAMDDDIINNGASEEAQTNNNDIHSVTNNDSDPFDAQPEVDSSINVGNLLNGGYAIEINNQLYYHDIHHHEFMKDGELQFHENHMSHMNYYDGWIYFTDFESKSLHKITTEGTDLVKLSDDLAMSIHIINDELVFRSWPDHHLGEGPLIGMDLDGHNRRTIIEEY